MERKLHIKKINNGWLVEREMETVSTDRYNEYSLASFAFINIETLEEFLSEEFSSMNE